MEAYKSLVKNLEAQMSNITRAVRFGQTFKSVQSDERAFLVLNNAILSTAQEIEAIEPEQSKALREIARRHRIDFDKAFGDSPILEKNKNRSKQDV